MDDAAFYFDLASPDAYLAAERVLQVLPGPAEWHPVLATELGPAATSGAEQLDRRARELGLQPLRMPAPFDSRLAMRAATYAKSIGRTVAFAQAAFRQAYAGGHSLADEDYVLIAAAACEMHPRALLAALGREAVNGELERATAAARAAGVRSVPAVRVGEEVFEGPDAPERAAARMASA
jgi:2-hydroxychromene-2-carboxylate isomerase